MSTPRRVIIVDDHPIFRDGVAATLEESAKFKVVGQGGSASDAIRLADEHRPALVLLDLNIPGGGLAAARAIAEAVPQAGIVALTVSESEEDVMAMLRAGARGYVLKGVSAGSLVGILESIVAGERYVSPTLAARLLVEVRLGEPAANPIGDLTTRETESLPLAGTELSNKETGLKLDLQDETVKYQMSRILGKHGVRHWTEAEVLSEQADRRDGSARRPVVTETIRRILEEAGAAGLNAQSVADRAETSGLKLNRNSVSSLLSRMKKNGEVVYSRRRYILHVRD